MTRQASLDLGVTGNCVVSALIDREARVVWSCLPRLRRRSRFSRAGRPQRPARRARPLVGRARRIRAQRAGIRRQHGGASHPALQFERFRRRGDRLLPALRALRPHVPPADAGAPRAPARRNAAHLRAPAAFVRLRGIRACDDARQQPHPLRERGPGAAAHHRRAGELRARGDAVPARVGHQLRARRRRVALRRHGCHGPRFPGGDRRPLAALVAAARHPRRVAGRRDPRGHHAEAVPVRGDRRDRRGDDHQHSRGAIERPQLGLPLLLAARRVLRGARAELPVRRRHDGALPALPRQHRRPGDRRAPAARLRDRARAAARRTRGAGACRLSRHGPGARRQPGLRAPPARCLRQRRAGDRAIVLRPAAAARRDRAGLPAPRARRRAGLARARDARCGHVGVAHARAHPHVLRADVLGGLRPPRAHRRAPRPAGARSGTGMPARGRSARRSSRAPSTLRAAASWRVSAATTWRRGSC